MKILLLALHRPNRAPSQRYRIEQYLPYLQSLGWEFDYAFLLSPTDDHIFYAPKQYLGKATIVLKSTWQRLRELLRNQHYDAIYVQREAYMMGSAFFETRWAKRAPLIFDFDDALWKLNTSLKHPQLGFLKNPNKFGQIMQAATAVWAGNDYLANYARRFNSNIHIVPSTINTDDYTPAGSPPEGPITIGWSGSYSTLPHFETLVPVLLQLRQTFGNRIRFRVMGDPHYQCPALQLQGIAWSPTTEVDELAQWHIGIMPLPMDDWSRGKCGMKGLQYMGMALPAVMQRIGTNITIVEEGVNGLLADTPDQWLHALTTLIQSENLRHQLGQAGRKTVVEQYSVNAWKDRYRALFEAVKQ